MAKAYKSMGLFIGQFNPLHKGHLYVRDKAQDIFDIVKIVRIFDPHKRSEYCVPSKHIDIQYSLNIVNLVQEFEKNYNVSIIRGIRNERDYLKERILFDNLRIEKPNLNFVHIFSSEQFKNYSSFWIKDLPPEDKSKYIM